MDKTEATEVITKEQHALDNTEYRVSPSEEQRHEICEQKVYNETAQSDEEYLSAEDGDGTDESEEEFIPTDNVNTDGDHSFLRDPSSDRNTSHNLDEEYREGEDDDDEDEEEKEPQIVDDLEDIRKKMEENLSEEEIEERKNDGQRLKDDGNVKFRNGDFDDAIVAYTEALEICPLSFHKERSIMFANRAACRMKKELYEEAIKDSSKALELHPHYMKALLRRAELYEKTEKLDEALKDYQQVSELDPLNRMARIKCVNLAEQIKDRNEKMKEEMMGKLKDLGNLVLRPFGLSTNNFQLQQDPNTGSYSVQFQQNAPNNGS